MIAISTFGAPQSLVLPVIERIYPKASELSEILNYNPCPECAEVFHNTPNLEMHLQKSHGRESNRATKENNGNVIKQFYCPEEGCKYSGLFKKDITGLFKKDFGIKYFTQHKYLKQHYIKMHMEKKFVCEQCGKGFATTSLHKHHLQECGLKFVCSCGVEYNTVQALLNHARRKMHTFVKSWPAVRARKSDHNANVGATRAPVIPILPKTKQYDSMATNTLNMGVKRATVIPILPKPKQYDAIVANTADALSELRCQKSIDIGIQTEPTAGQRRRRNVVKSSDTSRQTQTCEKRTRISSETQTVGEYCNKVKKNTNRRRKKSMETQTKVVEHTITSADIVKTVVKEEDYSVGKDIGLPELWFSSGAKTDDSLFGTALPELSGSLFEEPIKSLNQDSLFSELNSSDSTDQFLSVYMAKEDLDSKLCSIETQTEFSVENLFENFNDTISHIETQTSTELWDQYSNTCTQTCDDILLDFSDIETQTIWPDVSTDIPPE